MFQSSPGLPWGEEVVWGCHGSRRPGGGRSSVQAVHDGGLEVGGSGWVSDEEWRGLGDSTEAQITEGLAQSHTTSKGQSWRWEKRPGAQDQRWGQQFPILHLQSQAELAVREKNAFVQTLGPIHRSRSPSTGELSNWGVSGGGKRMELSSLQENIERLRASAPQRKMPGRVWFNSPCSS